MSEVIAMDFDFILLRPVPSFLSILMSCRQEEGSPKEAGQPACLECCGGWNHASNRGRIARPGQVPKVT